MSWWTTALYDTCSIITLDKLLLERAGISRHFASGFLALDESFTADQMRTETVARMRGRATTQVLPPAAELAELLRMARLPHALDECARARATSGCGAMWR